ncbi:MAG TPA: acetate/propionate family kinase, partial [Clostridiales bacterium]|nr:acetate/propionate family kinase [Clostridiales bacterium]
MHILSVNVGSTSFKYRLYRMDAAETELASGHFEGVARTTGSSRQQASAHTRTKDTPESGYQQAITDMLGFLNETGVMTGLPDAVAFKTVAALGVTGVVRLNEDVLSRMERLNALLPAHNPPYVAAIRQFIQLMPNTPLIASFETGFFSDMPEQAYLYPLPYALSQQGIRRNGAHGASHEYVTGWVTGRMGRPVKLISCHLGGSSSLAAVKDGRGVDTTIGLSMQTGLMHNNRIG